jgi:c-di-GMP-binding flagellar brake protein YcgR
MFEDTRPAAIGDEGDAGGLAEFRVDHPREKLSLLRQLRDGSVPINLIEPEGAAVGTTLWSLDDDLGRLNFAIDARHPQLRRMLDADEAVAVAYLDNVKLQFDLRGLLLVRSADSSALVAAMPSCLFRFQRRQAYRVRTLERGSPKAKFRHPSMPEMSLALRVLDVSIGGCAIFLPHDVPPLQPGTRLAEVQVELDADTRFAATLTLQHVTGIDPNARGVRLGCEWSPLGGNAERALQRYIDATQKQRRLLSGG